MEYEKVNAIPSMNVSAKEGTFDWIVNYDQLEPYLVNALANKPDSTSSDISIQFRELKVLVIGCGKIFRVTNRCDCSLLY